MMLLRYFASFASFACFAGATADSPGGRIEECNLIDGDVDLVFSCRS